MGPKGRLLELDCLRGIAAVSVVLFHFTLSTKTAFRFGCAGVELFFIISGFVIFLTIEKTNNYKDFLLSRFARLYPAYWTSMCITTLAMVAWDVMIKRVVTFPTVKIFAINLTMLQYYFRVRNIDAPYWTLIYELIFYVTILLVFLVKKLQKIEIIGFVILLICLLNASVIKHSFRWLHDAADIYFPLLVYFPLFMAGILFYRIKFYSLTWFRALLLALTLLTQIILFDDTGKIISMSHFEYGAILTIFYMVFLLYCYDRLKFIINPVFLFLGKISYSLYLVHDFISYSLLIPFFSHSRQFHLNKWVVYFLIVLPVVILIATLMNKFVEVPAMNYLKSRRGRGREFKVIN